MTKKLYKGIDIFKLVAALGIVAIHTGIRFFNILGRLGVPFFVVISSFFFFKHYFRLNNVLKRKNYIKKFLVRLGLLFLTWEVFYIPLALNEFLKISNRKIEGKSLLLYIFDFFYPVPSNANGWGPSWYLIAMFMALPIFIGIFYLCKKESNNFRYLVCNY
ncbi:acyltransferase family protein [Lactobacillus amylovorus]|uniref:acyltransferase family protein n=1 Tax=Lactobacillus amylovorus TaxID=1604 RepID=UPI002331347D|nr:acyltransferase family protein [Lactobacillus amylovorus]MDB6254885.1 acyltransferase family protein [Lactobacillus amylovorus]